MAKSLLEQLPEIVRNGKRQAQQILEQLEGANRVSLQTRELVIPARDTTALWSSGQTIEDVPEQPNRLIYGDNLLAMAALLAGDEITPSMRGKIDLIYIDPPYDSKADYRTKVELPGVELDQKPNTLEQFAYSDTWTNGTASYLEMMAPRIALMHNLLSETGSLYVHVDWHVGHYVKILLDEFFGKSNFRNQIAWIKNSLGAKSRATQFPRNQDLILFYSKSSSYLFKQMTREQVSYIDFSGGKERLPSGIKVDEVGRYYWSSPKGDYSAESVARLESEGRIERTATGNERVKYFVRRDGNRIIKDVVVDDTWSDIELVFRSSDPRTGYDTQKPEALIKRIIEASCPQGGVVADFFVGSGTTAAVAERLGRRWIATDLGKPAIMVTRKRLIDQDAKPFLYQAIGDYQVEQAKSTLGKKFKVGDLSRTVIEIFGAVPLPPEENSGGQLGRLPGSDELVVVDSPARLTTLSTLKRAQQLRDSKMGGFKSVTVLGWNFAADIAQALQNLNDPHLKVQVIPPDLLDRLKKKGKEGLVGNIRFSTLQYLEAHLEERHTNDESEALVVALENYVLVDPQAINLDDANREKLLKVMNAEPLALIEYWAIDPDYDGNVFRSLWQDYRGNTENDGDPLRVVTRTPSISVDRLSRDRKVCVRAVDVFGFESEVVITVPAARS